MGHSKSDRDGLRQVGFAGAAGEREKRGGSGMTRVCRKAAAFCRKNVRTALIFGLCITASGAAVTAMTSVSYAVSINGEEMGSVQSRSAVTAAVTQAEAQLTEIFGYDYSLEAQVSVSPDLDGTAGADIGDEIEEVILESVPGVVSACSVSVDGKALCSVRSKAAAERVLENIRQNYTTPGTTDVRFVEEVAVTEGYAAADDLYSAAELAALLDPSAGVLTVEATVTADHRESIPHTTVYRADDTSYAGDETVVAAGQDGEATVTVCSIYRNGILRETYRAETRVTRAPVAEIVARGTLDRPKTASVGTYIWPVDGIITSYFGYRDIGIGSSNHAGIDLAGDGGQPICAADGGEVIFSGECGGYGNLVQIRHDNGEITYYAHCSALIAQEGERVYQGQLIALMGSTGVSSGDHCHFEIRTADDVPTDPLLYFPGHTGDTVSLTLSADKQQALETALNEWHGIFES